MGEGKGLACNIVAFDTLCYWYFNRTLFSRDST